MAIPVNKSDAALQVGSALLQPTLDMAGKALAKWFVEKDPIQRGADLLGNVGEVTRAKVLGGLVDEVAAPSVDIEKYKEAVFDAKGKHNYGGAKRSDPYYVAKQDRPFGEAYYRAVPKDTSDWVDTSPYGDYAANPSQSQYDTEQATVLTPNTFASNLGINDLERAKYVSEIAGYGATTAALGAGLLGMNALMRGNKPRSAYSLPVQDSGGYNPNVEASRASYEYAAKLEMLKQQNRERNEWARQQARTPGVQQYSSPPIGGYGHYPDMNFNAAQMASSIINAPTPVYG